MFAAQTLPIYVNCFTTFFDPNHACFVSNLIFARKTLTLTKLNFILFFTCFSSALLGQINCLSILPIFHPYVTYIGEIGGGAWESNVQKFDHI